MKRIIAVCIAAAGILAAGAMSPHLSGAATSPSISMEEVIKFQQESTGPRGEIVVKKLELIGETMKQPVDSVRVKALVREVIDLQAKIGALANKHGLPGPSAFQSVIKNMQTNLTDAERETILKSP